MLIDMEESQERRSQRQQQQSQSVALDSQTFLIGFAFTRVSSLGLICVLASIGWSAVEHGFEMAMGGNLTSSAIENLSSENPEESKREKSSEDKSKTLIDVNDRPTSS